MNSVPEPIEYLKTIPIRLLCVGDILVNLGPVLEIMEESGSFSLVIQRMQERQVWRFQKDEELTVRRSELSI